VVQLSFTLYLSSPSVLSSLHQAITARYSTALADAETKALQSASQLHEEALAAAKTRELELQRLLDTALANEQQALRARHEMEGSAAQLQHEV
jgi:hypothetical protein